jgi:hypothetical protein
MTCSDLLVQQFTNMYFDDGSRSGFSSVLHEGVRNSYIMDCHFRNVGNDQPHSPATLRPDKQRQVLTAQHIGLAMQPFPIVRRRERLLICSWDRSTIRRPAHSLITIPTELPWLYFSIRSLHMPSSHSTACATVAFRKVRRKSNFAEIGNSAYIWSTLYAYTRGSNSNPCSSTPKPDRSRSMFAPHPPNPCYHPAIFFRRVPVITPSSPQRKKFNTRFESDII